MVTLPFLIFCLMSVRQDIRQIVKGHIGIVVFLAVGHILVKPVRG